MLTDIKNKVEKNVGNWVGCDWTTDFGDFNLDLSDMTSDDAEDKIMFWEQVGKDIENGEDPDITINEAVDMQDKYQYLSTLIKRMDWDDISEDDKEAIGKVASELVSTWEEARDWLFDVEDNAEAAEDSAVEAVKYLEEGNLNEALEKAIDAYDIESDYGDAPTWGFLRYDIEEIQEEVQEIFDANEDETDETIDKALSQLGFNANAVKKIMAAYQ